MKCRCQDICNDATNNTSHFRGIIGPGLLICPYCLNREDDRPIGPRWFPGKGIHMPTYICYAYQTQFSVDAETYFVVINGEKQTVPRAEINFRREAVPAKR